MLGGHTVQEEKRDAPHGAAAHRGAKSEVRIKNWPAD